MHYILLFQILIHSKSLLVVSPLKSVESNVKMALQKLISTNLFTKSHISTITLKHVPRKVSF